MNHNASMLPTTPFDAVHPSLNRSDVLCSDVIAPADAQTQTFSSPALLPKDTTTEALPPLTIGSLSEYYTDLTAALNEVRGFGFRREFVLEAIVKHSLVSTLCSVFKDCEDLDAEEDMALCGDITRMLCMDIAFIP